MKYETVNIDAIWKERNKLTLHTGLCPEYIMIHPNNKRKLFKEVCKSEYTMRETNMHFLGMKAIWTTDIGENEVIATYGGH